MKKTKQNTGKFYLILIIVVLSKQLLWSAFIPLWHFPDEQAHFAQLQNIAEWKTTAQIIPNSTSREILESEKLLGTNRDWQGNNQFTHRASFNIPYTNISTGFHEEIITSFPSAYRKDLVIREATFYPPLYYTFGSLFYRIVFSNDLFHRVAIVRLYNLVIFVGFSMCVYSLGRLLFPSQQCIANTFAIMVIFHPMFSFLGAGINSDNLFNFIFAVSTFLCIRILTKGWSTHDTLATILTVLAAILTKPQGKLLPLIYLFPLFFASFQTKRLKIIIWGSMIIISLWIFGSVISAILTGTQYLPDVRADISIQSLLSRDFIDHIKSSMVHTYREVIPWYWGVFRWLSLTYPRYIHRIINWTLVLAGIGILLYWYQVLKKREVIIPTKLSLFLTYSSVMYFLGLLVFDFLFRKSQGFSFGVQGRYYFPLLTSQMALCIIGLATIMKWFRLKIELIRLIGVGMITLSGYAWYFVITSYYNIYSLTHFFIQASQYKPWYFKSPLLEVYILVGLISTIFLVWYYLRYEVNKT